MMYLFTMWLVLFTLVCVPTYGKLPRPAHRMSNTNPDVLIRLDSISGDLQTSYKEQSRSYEGPPAGYEATFEVIAPNTYRQVTQHPWEARPSMTRAEIELDQRYNDLAELKFALEEQKLEEKELAQRMEEQRKQEELEKKKIKLAKKKANQSKTNETEDEDSTGSSVESDDRKESIEVRLEKNLGSKKTNQTNETQRTMAKSKARNHPNGLRFRRDTSKSDKADKKANVTKDEILRNNAKNRPNGYRFRKDTSKYLLASKKTNKTNETKDGIAGRLSKSNARKHRKGLRLRKKVSSDLSPERPRRSATTPWARTAWFGREQLALSWRVLGRALVVRAEARAQGHLALALGHDALIVWMDDDGKAFILDCHLVSGVPMSDFSQDYKLEFALRNNTHLLVEFRRPLDTCDPDDITINEDAVSVRWTAGSGDPRGAGWRGWQEEEGGTELRLLGGGELKEKELHLQWDVTIKDVEIPANMGTMFWCKIFSAPSLLRKHHVVGFRPLAGPAARHAVLHECTREASSPPQELEQWEAWARGTGTYGPDMPREWAACLAPVAAWAVGSQGEMFPEHVGIPLGDPEGVTYYMLEIHYENPTFQRVLDTSGLSIIYTPQLRQHDAGFLVTGITVSALHVLPAGQDNYHSGGYCTEMCTQEMFPENGIYVASVRLHSHSAGRKLALRHIRDGYELPRIAQDSQYDYKHQQSKNLLGDRNIRRGDALLMECSYDTRGRKKVTLGGYSSSQEMCLAFVLHYPRIPLAGCYSMTPVKEFFETFGVDEFFNREMKQVENMFLASGSLDLDPEPLDFEVSKNSKDNAVQPYVDQGVRLLEQLVIRHPVEFMNKSFMAHLNELPWGEPLLTRRIEETLHRGKHMTFCKRRDDSLATPIEIRRYPKFLEGREEDDSSKQCHYKLEQNSTTSTASHLAAIHIITLSTAALLAARLR